ncbi:DNA-binding NarL/FixJ family response regulator [Catenulispora sp. MAP12-49]|uniref:response regulator n=1 Tax=Catenulispora sp. MAP12-49 TaxID=3156302 RepID=UPI0035166380
MSAPITVLVADDQALVRAGFAGIVAMADGFEVVAQACDGAQAVAAARAVCPDVVLMDVRMPGMDGLEATRLITAAGPSRVLILTTFDLDDYVFGALRAGASGFLLKDTPPEGLLAAIEVVASGEALLAPTATRRLIQAFARQSQAAVADSGMADSAVAPAQARLRGLLTARELEVLTLIAAGLTNTEIAERLSVSTGTVKTHISHLLAKLGARDRVQLVIQAFRAGLA